MKAVCGQKENFLLHHCYIRNYQFFEKNKALWHKKRVPMDRQLVFTHLKKCPVGVSDPSLTDHLSMQESLGASVPV